MAKKTVTEITMQNSLDATLQKVLDILEAEDEKSFEEKKEIAIQLLKEQDNSPLAETLVNHALADQEGKRISADFWESGKILSASSNPSIMSFLLDCICQNIMNALRRELF